MRKILDDRPLDEAHPLWPLSHYGAHKAAIEAFVVSYGLGNGYEICALRPTGVYGLAHPPVTSKWVSARKSGSARRISRMSTRWQRSARSGRGQGSGSLANGGRDRREAFNCYDRYVSEYEVAALAQRISGSKGTDHRPGQTAKTSD